MKKNISEKHETIIDPKCEELTNKMDTELIDDNENSNKKLEKNSNRPLSSNLKNIEL